MRLLILTAALMLVVAACNGVADDDTDDVAEPDPAPTEDVADEEPPDPTPTPAPVEDDGDAVDDDPTPTPEPDVTEDEPADLQEAVDQVVENVVELRGLEMVEDLEFELITSDELREHLEEDTEIEQLEIDMDWTLRLIPDRDEDIEQLLIDMQVAQVAGFYDPETQETFVISDDDDLSAMDEVILAHEIVHALQDQHFDLGLLVEPEPEYDASMALRSVIEGDAVIAQEVYAQEYLDEERMSEFQQEAMAAQQDEEAQAAMEAVPSYYMESFLFPYSAGPEFFLPMYEGDMSVFDEYLEDPPVSTYQVLNGEAYRAGEIDDPVDVELPDIEGRLGDDWEQHEHGTFGVFNLFMMLNENGAEQPQVVLDGWAGGYVGFYADADEEHVLAAVSTVWSDADEAAMFEDELASTFADYDEEDGVWTDGERYHTVIVDDDTVDLISSTDPDALLDAAEIE